MLRLLAWTGVIVVLLALPASRKLERKRENAVTSAEGLRMARPRLAKAP
jgi:hypothetical protein